MSRYDAALKYRMCTDCRSTHVGLTTKPTQCPYLSVHHVRRTIAPRRIA